MTQTWISGRKWIDGCLSKVSVIYVALHVQFKVQTSSFYLFHFLHYRLVLVYDGAGKRTTLSLVLKVAG